MNIYVFGLGAIGSNIMTNLTFDLPDVNLTGIDFDKVEYRNISVGTQEYDKSCVNKLKTQALQLIIHRLNGKRISTVNKEIQSSDDISKIITQSPALIVDSVDNNDIRRLFSALDSVDVLHVGFSPDMSGQICWSETYKPATNYSEEENVDICTEMGARSFIKILSSLASMNIVKYVRDGVKNNLYVDKNFNFFNFS